MTKDTNDESVRLNPNIISIDEGGNWLDSRKLFQKDLAKINDAMKTLTNLEDSKEVVAAKSAEVLSTVDMNTEFMKAMLSEELINKVSDSLISHLSKLTAMGELTMVEAIIIKDLFLKGKQELYP